MAAHGVARSTLDVDLLATARECFDPATWRPLAACGISTDVRRGADDDPLAGIVRFRRHGTSPVDVVVGKAAWQAGVIERARPGVIDGVAVPVATAADLVLLKLYAAGPQDLYDIEQLLGVHDRAALVAEVDAAVEALPTDARALWRRVRG